MCDDVSWYQILAEDCPNMCGFCLLGGCVDVAVECKTSVCNTIGMENFAAVS